MNIRELNHRNQVAGQLLAKLERIAQLYAQIPNEAALLAMMNHAGTLAEQLEKAKKTCGDEAFPTTSSLRPLVVAANSIAEDFHAAVQLSLDCSPAGWSSDRNTPDHDSRATPRQTSNSLSGLAEATA
jgi:hypothetical protein